MPSKNILKKDVADAYYHIYARGNNKQEIFLEPADYRYFEGLFLRYLSKKAPLDKNGMPYPNFNKGIELLAYCLMTNHFHILIYQIDTGNMTALMRSLMTSYSRYFNLKYKRTGRLFETSYKAVLISQQSYLEHISRYIHLNPRYWQNYPYSSIKYYKQGNGTEWLYIEKVLSMFSDTEDYLTFLNDYEDRKQMLKEIKHELANH